MGIAPSHRDLKTANVLLAPLCIERQELKLKAMKKLNAEKPEKLNADVENNTDKLNADNPDKLNADVEADSKGFTGEE